jgi:ketosteroid isomerase-like protein
MKNRWLCGFIGLLSLGAASWSQAQQTSGATEQAVAALEQTWLKAIQTNNSDLIAPLLSERLVITSSDGKVTGKAAALAEVKDDKWSSVTNTDMKVSIFGNTAIATYVFRGNGTDAAGKPISPNERWTDTWVKMPNGQWQCVAGHGSPIKP